MNDRYLYRAKRTDNGAWVEGFYFHTETMAEGHKDYIIPNGGSFSANYGVQGGWVTHEKFIEIAPSTICQCTGMPDKNSKVAYEHDIIETPVGNAKIIWNCSLSPTDNHINVGFEVVFLDATANDNYRHDLGYWIGKSEVIGNIFDNPELLEVRE